MNVQLFRIDDRLIHGQVVLGWAKFLSSKYLILCDNEVAENDWEGELYLSCVPAELTAKILNIDDTIHLLKNGTIEPEKTIVLVKSPEVLLNIINDGYSPENVNIGGLHFGETRKKYLPYLFLSDKEISELQSCIKKGVNIYCQDVPNAKIYQLTELLNN
jgi:mannose/fructose/N-acetylgalactosamine-specific phosphotransferase system component IIB